MSHKININGEEVDLNEANLKFDETTLSNYLQSEGSFYNHFGGKLAIAEFLQQKAELEVETLEGTKFRDYKETDGGSDKLTDAKVASDPDVVIAKEKALQAKLVSKLVLQHLKAWDKNHENAQSLGHTLRKEMDKLNSEIFRTGLNSPRYDELERLVNEGK